jgi:hypothetical protein
MLYSEDVEVNRIKESDTEDERYYCDVCKKTVKEERIAHQLSIAHQVAKEKDNVDYFPVEHNSKGYLIMKSQGYQLGRGLGKDDQGIVNPIKPLYKGDKLGLGAKAKAGRSRDVEVDDAATRRNKKVARKEADKDQRERSALLNYLKN